MHFKSCDVDDMYSKVKELIDNPDLRKSLAQEGQKNILNLWSAKCAVANLLHFINDLYNGRDTSIIDGPCSKA